MRNEDELATMQKQWLVKLSMLKRFGSGLIQVIKSTKTMQIVAVGLTTVQIKYRYLM